VILFFTPHCAGAGFKCMKDYILIYLRNLNFFFLCSVVHTAISLPANQIKIERGKTQWKFSTRNLKKESVTSTRAYSKEKVPLGTVPPVFSYIGKIIKSIKTYIIVSRV
jgi:hypothetical protein